MKEKRAELSHLAHMTSKISKYSPETCCIVGNYYSLRGEHERSITYFQRALKLNRNIVSAWTLMGHEYVELRNTSAAISCYREAIGVNDNDYRAWYGLGQTYEMLHMYQYALYYFRNAATLRSSDARMWCAIGACLVRIQANASDSIDAILAYERAAACDDREGVAVRELAKLHKNRGERSKAAKYYRDFIQVTRGLYLGDALNIDNNNNNESSGSSSSSSNED